VRCGEGLSGLGVYGQIIEETGEENGKPETENRKRETGQSVRFAFPVFCFPFPVLHFVPVWFPRS
jgi:hypothetical protein